MTEDFDALQTFQPLIVIGLAAGLLVLAILLEFLLRFAERWVKARNWQKAGVVLRALHWQPLFWLMVLGASWLLAGYSEISVERQQGLRILGALVLISVAIVTVRIITGWVKLITARHRSASTSILNYLINGLAVLVVLTVALWTLNVSTPLLVLTLLGSTFGISAALREPLTNLFAGVALTASNRLRPGDFVQLPSGERGRVLDIGWDVTSIHQGRNSLIIVPNARLNQTEIINFDRPTSDFELQVNLGVSYESDLDEVERVTNEVADGVLNDILEAESSPPCYIRYKEFRDSDILFTVYLNCPFADRVPVKHEFIKRLHWRYGQAGIVMPAPIRTLNTQADEPLKIVFGEPSQAPARREGAGPQATTQQERTREETGE